MSNESFLGSINYAQEMFARHSLTIPGSTNNNINPHYREPVNSRQSQNKNNPDLVKCHYCGGARKYSEDNCLHCGGPLIIDGGSTFLTPDKWPELERAVLTTVSHPGKSAHDFLKEGRKVNV